MIFSTKKKTEAIDSSPEHSTGIVFASMDPVSLLAADYNQKLAFSTYLSASMPVSLASSMGD
jgi:hypothetical protein